MLKSVTTALLTITAVGLWGALAYGCLRSTPIGLPQGTLLLIAGALASIMAGLDQIQSFSASATGVSAQMRETVKRAENAITEVQRLAKVTGMFMVDAMQAKQFIGTPPVEELEDRKVEILNLLRDIGLSPAEVAEVAVADKRWVRLRYEKAITRGVPSNPAVNERWRVFADRFKGLDDRPPLDEIMAEIEAVGDKDPRRDALADDLRHYLQTGNHRRPRAWAARDGWVTDLPPA